MVKVKENLLSSLFVGRFQPFHQGHKALIETVLKQDKSVVIAIRDTEISHKNPYTVFERWTMIQNQLKDYGELVKIVVIPDIDEICYGRDVGYKLRKIDLDKQTEKISGTSERIKHPPTKLIIWLTGQSGSGKTTLANLLVSKLNAIVLDGDEMRQSVSQGLGFSQEDRHIHNLRVARLAKVLSKRTPVVVSVIAPFEKTRQQIDDLIKPTWVYVERKLRKDKDKPYQPPKNPDLIINSDKQMPEEAVLAIINFLREKKLWIPD